MGVDYAEGFQVPEIFTVSGVEFKEMRMGWRWGVKIRVCVWREFAECGDIGGVKHCEDRR